MRRGLAQRWNPEERKPPPGPAGPLCYAYCCDYCYVVVPSPIQTPTGSSASYAITLRHCLIPGVALSHTGSLVLWRDLVMVDNVVASTVYHVCLNRVSAGTPVTMPFSECYVLHALSLVCTMLPYSDPLSVSPVAGVLAVPVPHTYQAGAASWIRIPPAFWVKYLHLGKPWYGAVTPS